MLFEKKNGLFLGRFGALLKSEGVVHAFSTRRGGTSDSPYDSLNLGLNTGDAPERIEENRLRFFNASGVEEDGLVILKQVHGDSVHVAESPGTIADADASITAGPGLFLSVQVADCVSVFLVDPVKKAAGLAHAGWRGTEKAIAAKTAAKMAVAFGCSARDITAFIGPSIGPCCCEVGEETASLFPSRYVVGGRLDLWRANEDQLVDAGLRRENVIQSRLCTACHGEWFFSHRASGGKTGRMLGILGLK
jgi:YfiH family protein